MPRSPPLSNGGGGRLWQTGRMAKCYDKIGPCLGSGGMGSVWAARVSDCSENSAVSGSWVAVKAIPMYLGGGETTDVGAIHNGLRECLSTFKDLSPVHVVRYESYWLEEPGSLPAELSHVCEKHVVPPLRTHPTGPSTLRRESSNSACGSIRFHERADTGAVAGVGRIGSIGSRFDDFNGMTRHRSSSDACLTPTGIYDTCGFVWETVAETSSGGENHLNETLPPSPAAASASPRRLRQRDGDLTIQRSSCLTAVLFIEMELMGVPPDSTLLSNTDTRMTLRSWLLRSDRTLSDAADVFGSMMLSVRHIHRKRIVHADLKPDNLFCVADRSRIMSVRIGDFGLAAENQQGRQFCYGVFRGSRITGGTPGYVAPEIVLAERDQEMQVCMSEKVDIFACAVMLLELLLTPFGTQMERVRVLETFRSEQPPNNIPKFVGTRLPKTRQLVQDMSEHDPAVRLSAEEVFKRFEKEVRKELCRSSTQLLCQLSDPRSGRQESAVQPRKEKLQDQAGTSQNNHRRKGRKVGRRGG